MICKGEWEGKETLGLRLNWEKRYITLGPVATLLAWRSRPTTRTIYWVTRKTWASAWR